MKTPEEILNKHIGRMYLFNKSVPVKDLKEFRENIYKAMEEYRDQFDYKKGDIVFAKVITPANGRIHTLVRLINDSQGIAIPGTKFDIDKIIEKCSKEDIQKWLNEEL